MTYIIATEEISLAEQMRLRNQAVGLAKERASAKWQLTPSQLDDREANYVADFILPFAPAFAAGLAGWLTQPFLAAGAQYSVFATNAAGAFAAVAPICPTNQIWVFYKAAVLTVAGPDPASTLQFRKGMAANLICQVELESLYGKDVQDGYFSAPVSYESPDMAVVLVTARVALGVGVGCRVKLGCILVENRQNTTV
jgi:hypothetical protein